VLVGFLLIRVQSRRAWLVGRKPSQGRVDVAQAYAFRVLAVEHFEGVTVEDGNDTASEVSERGIGINKENEKCQ
jgi:hypothetical protein